MVRKAAKAQKYADEQGLCFVKMISMCPLAWRGRRSGCPCRSSGGGGFLLLPALQVENGIRRTINYDPEEKGKKVPGRSG